MNYDFYYERCKDLIDKALHTGFVKAFYEDENTIWVFADKSIIDFSKVDWVKVRCNHCGYVNQTIWPISKCRLCLKVFSNCDSCTKENLCCYCVNNNNYTGILGSIRTWKG